MTDYTLAVSDAEIQRYRQMAARARSDEAQLWRRAGIVPGAVVADVGCGPAAISVVVAEVVGPSGRVIGVEPDEGARGAARRLLADAGVHNVELRPGTAADTGVSAGSVDVVMLRHVLGHNAPDEQRIVDHLAALIRPTGSVYLVDVDGTAVRVLDLDPSLEDLNDRYRELQRRRGNDLQAGLRLAKLLDRAGLDLVLHQGSYTIMPMPIGLRPPAWAARDAMLAHGVASEDDAQRWEEAFVRMDTASARPTLFVPTFVAIGASRQPVGP
jgi:ubiquinone/menaquinone biosynthesis C-methylase UbiE